MKKLLMAGLVAALLAGCGGGGSSGGGATPAVVRGVATGANGGLLAGATIQSGGTSATSGSDGSYSLSLAPGPNLKILASKSGCLDTFAILTLAAGQAVLVDFSLPPIGQNTPLTSLLTTPATVTDSRGAEVRLTANTLVDSSGAAVDAATVALTTALPSDPRFAASFPGLFVGTKAGTDAAIESFGFVTIAVTSSTGLACNLRAGATADLAIPVATAADPGTPTIDLWSLDESTGKWSFVAPATRDTSGTPVVYRAQVTHFSRYNLDQPIASSLPFTITVKNTSGTTMAGASVLVTSTNQTGGGLWSGRTLTGADGKVFYPTVPQGNMTVNALAGGLAGVGYSYQVANGAATMTVVVSSGGGYLPPSS